MNTAGELFSRLSAEVDKVVIGKREAKAVLFSAFLARGNVLLEGVPGIAKTLLARAWARVLGLRFSRIQFTPDLMPSDILGTSIFHQARGEFEFVPGPIFSDVVLADEINRAPAKTQAALLEAMEERQVTIDNTTYPMSGEFMVFATQNPLEFEGTYALPEAQLDRFMVRITMGYPSEEEETAILSGASISARDACDSIAAVEGLFTQCGEARETVERVVVDDRIVAYVRGLVRESREMEELLLGSSPRAGQMLIRLCRAFAAVTGGDFVTPDHVRELAPYVLPHRWVLKPAAEIQQEPIAAVLSALFDRVKVPQ